jgi:hypothetical protein
MLTVATLVLAPSPRAPPTMVRRVKKGEEKSAEKPPSPTLTPRQ